MKETKAELSYQSHNNDKNRYCITNITKTSSECNEQQQKKLKNLKIYSNSFAVVRFYSYISSALKSNNPTQHLFARKYFISCNSFTLMPSSFIHFFFFFSFTCFAIILRLLHCNAILFCLEDTYSKYLERILMPIAQSIILNNVRFTYLQLIERVYNLYDNFSIDKANSGK